ncbi:hypothetical protein SeMB42_g00564 [Synchytrium endobioticum]|uniref:Uncharacterized protein n=1 Tax=Synchytrium endobioticum TaxID=286115 RepID=A0A507DF94_9FUNG|nr:hypothetical protein SeLEV6574_g01154 [Synchytrium endobioticum]TPX53891.1 hypothetical protein SeMB42_g00564 [Synchytrium endobioticum]
MFAIHELRISRIASLLKERSPFVVNQRGIAGQIVSKVAEKTVNKGVDKAADTTATALEQGLQAVKQVAATSIPGKDAHQVDARDLGRETARATTKAAVGVVEGLGEGLRDAVFGGRDEDHKNDRESSSSDDQKK